MSVQNKNQNWPFVVNLGNSIIGVSILTMPFCFKQCGIILGMLVLLFCTWLTLASCQLLVKAGIVSHRRSYEFLAYHTYGAAGKFTVEIGMIGLQLGTLIAQIVVIGDLGPPIISSLFGITSMEHSPQTRTYLIVILCLLFGLPLGLMKDLHNVSRASTICIIFYVVFIFYVLWMSLSSLWSGSWYSHVNLWRPQGIFQCLPIMSFSFGCQTQLFILYDALPEPSLHVIKSITHSAVNLCSVSYLLVGFFGYITFYQADIPGDIITVFPSSLATHLIKLGFVMSIAITFPVIIFPCRASIYTLMFQKKSKLEDMASNYIPEFLFKAITVAIVVSSMIVAILIPNVEFILGLNGAITGTLICYIFPALFFLRVMSSKAEGKTIAQIVLVLGVSILLMSTFTTLYAQDKGHVHHNEPDKVTHAVNRIINSPKAFNSNIGAEKLERSNNRPKVQDVKEDRGKRVEPPVPDAPGPDVQVGNEKKSKDDKETGNAGGQNVVEVKQPGEKETSVEHEARADSGKEGEGPAPAKQELEHRQEKLLAALELQRKEQEKLLQEQKALLQELKDHKEHDHKEAGGQQQGAQQPAENVPPAGDLQQQAGPVEQQQQNAILQAVPQQQVQFVGQDPRLQQQQAQPNVHGVVSVKENLENLQQPVNAPLQGNQQQLMNAPVLGNQQQLVNALAQGKQQQQLGNVPVQGNQQQLGNVPVQGNQQQLGNVPVQGNQQQLGNVPMQGNQQLGNAPMQENQQQLGNVPVQGNQQQLGNVPMQGNQQQFVNVPAQDNQQQQPANLPSQHIQEQQQQPVNVLVPGTGQQQGIQAGGAGVQAGQAVQVAPLAGEQKAQVDTLQQQQQQNAVKVGNQLQAQAGARQDEDHPDNGDRDLLRKKREVVEDPTPAPQGKPEGADKEEMRRKLKSSTDLKDESVENLLNNLNADNGLNSLKQSVAVGSLKAKDGA